MAENENGGKREEVPLERIVLSNMYSLEALIDVLAEKGLVTREEVLVFDNKSVGCWHKAKCRSPLHGTLSASWGWGGIVLNHRFILPVHFTAPFLFQDRFLLRLTRARWNRPGSRRQEASSTT